jgi:hypothetical protein
MLGRAPSRSVSPKERALDAKDRARAIAAGAIAKIPEDKRRPALFGAIAFVVLLFGFFLWLGLSGSDEDRARDDAARDADRSGAGDKADPSATDSEQEAEPPPPVYRGKGKKRKRVYVYEE